MLCRLGVSRSGFYAARSRRGEPARVLPNEHHLRAAFTASDAAAVAGACRPSCMQGRSCAWGDTGYEPRTSMGRPVWQRKFIHTTDSRHSKLAHCRQCAEPALLRRPMQPGSRTSPTSARAVAGCTWRRCWICTRARLSAGP